MNLMTVFFLQAPAAGPDGSMMWIMLIAMFAIIAAEARADHPPDS